MARKVELFRGPPFMTAHKGIVIVGDRVMNVGEASLMLAQLAEVIDHARGYIEGTEPARLTSVTCTACGHSWESKSPPGSTTRCKCTQHLVVPGESNEPV